jgi:hypothetical protein
MKYIGCSAQPDCYRGSKVRIYLFGIVLLVTLTTAIPRFDLIDIKFFLKFPQFEQLVA